MCSASNTLVTLVPAASKSPRVVPGPGPRKFVQLAPPQVVELVPACNLLGRLLCASTYVATCAGLFDTPHPTAAANTSIAVNFLGSWSPSLSSFEWEVLKFPRLCLTYVEISTCPSQP